MQTIRTKVMKSYLYPAEELVILQECSLAGVSRSDQARNEMLGWAHRQRNGRRSNTHQEGPSCQNHRAQLFPPPRSYGVVPKMRIHV